MTDPRPRSFVWIAFNGNYFPQIWFDKPRVGSAGLKPVAEFALDESEYALTLDQLVAKYPAPSIADPGSAGVAMVKIVNPEATIVQKSGQPDAP
jgi:hypothetical protein